MQLDQRDHFKRILEPYTVSPFQADKADGGYTIVVRKDIPRDVLALVQEDAATIGYKVYRLTSPDAWLFHFVCVAPKVFYVTLITKSVIDGANLYAELADYATRTNPVILTEGRDCYVIVWNDKQGQLQFTYDIIMGDGLRKELHFVDLAMHEDDNDPQPDNNVSFKCPRCTKRATLPRYTVFGEDSATLKCPHCSDTFSVREVIW